MKKPQRIHPSVQEIIEKNVPVRIAQLVGIVGVGPEQIKYVEHLGLISPEWDEGLSTRACGVLSDLGIHSKEDTKRAILSGKLSPVLCLPERIGGNRKYGWKTHKEVCAWVGLPEPYKRKHVLKCPHCGKGVPYTSEKMLL